MKNIKKSALFLMLSSALISFRAEAQLTYGNEQFLFNPVLVNPSLAGLHNGQVQMGYDARWVGIEGAPKTGFLRFDKMFNGNTGWDVAIVSDRVGPVSSVSIANAFAFHLKITDQTKLSFGLKHHLTQNYLNLDSKTITDNTDPSLMAVNQTGIPVNNFDASLAFYNPEQFLIGFSYRNIIPQARFRNTKVIADNPMQTAVLSLHGWYGIQLGGIGIESFADISTSSNNPTNINVGAMGVLAEKYAGGLNFSPGNQIGIFTYIKATEKIQIFYNYNLPISDIIKVSKQSHGIGIAFRLGKETTTGSTFFIQPTNESTVSRMF